MSIKIILIYYSRIKEKFGMRKEVKRAEGRRIMTREKINRCSVLGIQNLSRKWDQFLPSINFERELCQGRNFPENTPTQHMSMEHVRVVLSSNMSKKIIVREICPNNICPGNISKLYMSEGHATFDNVRNECSRTIPAQNVRRHNARNICQKWQFPVNMSTRWISAGYTQE